VRFWTGRAPVLFPTVGSLKNGCFTAEGQSYPLDKHGFARTQVFEPSAVGADAAEFVLTSSDALRRLYPYDFALRISYRLTGRSLAVGYTLENHNDRMMPASIGAHEAYACPEGVGAYRILFEQVETLQAAVIEDSLLTGRTRTVLAETSCLPLCDALFADGALVFTDLRSASLILANRDNSRRIRVDYAGFPYLGIWMLPGASYVCIEPWCGLPDAADATGRLEDKRGILLIPPRQVLSRTHTLTVET
jgi:galactose mutarotase-like enzyme